MGVGEQVPNPCLIGQRNTSALTVALQDLFKALYAFS